MATRSLSVLLLVAVACAGDPQVRDVGDDSSGDETTGGSSEGGVTPTTSATTVSTSEGDPSSDGGDDTSTTNDDPFVFEQDAPDEYTQVDRMGMPGLAIALVDDQDDYNRAGPLQDVAGDFVPQLTLRMTALHAAFDNGLVALGLTPCDVDTCMAQATPLVIPDVIHIDLAEEPGFPNGRLLTDPAMDIALAVFLLDLEAHDIGDLAALPLDPTENDVPFLADFPHLAPHH